MSNVTVHCPYCGDNNNIIPMEMVSKATETTDNNLVVHFKQTFKCNNLTSMHPIGVMFTKQLDNKLHIIPMKEKA